MGLFSGLGRVFGGGQASRLREAAEFALDMADRIRDARVPDATHAATSVTSGPEVPAPGETSRSARVDAAAEVLRANPVLRSRMDGERWWQNRLIVGPLILLIGTIFPDIQLTADQVVAAGPFLEVAGLLLTLVGGFLSKYLGPMGLNVLRWVLPDALVDRIFGPRRNAQ